MTEKKLKEILKISDWQEVQKPEQFLTLMNYYYDLAPGVQEKIIGICDRRHCLPYRSCYCRQSLTVFILFNNDICCLFHRTFDRAFRLFFIFSGNFFHRSFFQDLFYFL